MKQEKGLCPFFPVPIRPGLPGSELFLPEKHAIAWPLKRYRRHPCLLALRFRRPRLRLVPPDGQKGIRNNIFGRQLLRANQTGNGLRCGQHHRLGHLGGPDGQQSTEDRNQGEIIDLIGVIPNDRSPTTAAPLSLLPPDGSPDPGWP